MSTREGELSKSTLVSKIAPMCIRNIFTSKINMNGRLKLIVDLSGKLLVNGKKLTTRN